MRYLVNGEEHKEGCDCATCDERRVIDTLDEAGEGE